MAPTNSLRLVFKATGSTSRADNPSSSNSEFSLPEELITEIIVRLPVKSLLKFKCVSKLWLSLISNPQFIRSHSSMEPDGLNLQILYVSNVCKIIKKCGLYPALQLQEADPSRRLSALEFPGRNFRVLIGIINGLICLNLKGTDLCVWNPALNKIKHFNLCPEARRRGGKYFFSFGYEESNDDYKVVCLKTVKDNDFDAEVSIYSLKSDSWRRIDQLEGFYLPNPGVFAHGKIYWFGIGVSTPKSWKIVSLDMLSEKFVELQLPDFDDGEYILQLGGSGGRLFVLCDYVEGEKVDVWLLDKCGVEESWCKVVSFTYNDDIHKFRSCYSPKLCNFNYRVLCILSNGEIVFGNGHGLLVYDGKKRGYRMIKLVVDTKTCWTVDAYVESLVWPNYA